VRKTRFKWLGIPVLLSLALIPSLLQAQDRAPEELSLENAIRIAEGTNPLLLADLNNEDVSNWNIRAAYGALVPSASANSGMQWQGSGETQFGSVTLSQLGFTNQPSYYFSSYNLGLSYTLDGRILLAIPQAKSDKTAQIALGEATQSQTVFQVTQAYLEVLRQGEGLLLAEQELERARGNVRLSQGQMEVGSGTPMDVRQAEVALGRARVNVLTSEHGVRTGKFRLTQAMGLDPHDDFELTSSFEIRQPTWDEGELTSMALERNPQMRGLRASVETQAYNTKMAKAAYLPTLSFSAGISGFAREASNPDFLVAQAQASALGSVGSCEAMNEMYRRLNPPLPTRNCSSYLFTERDRRAIVDGNDNFPFNFTKNPPSASMMISLPIFQGLRRERDVAAARIAEEDSRHQVRDQELRLKTDLASSLSTLETAYEAALIEDENQVWADEQLRLAQERYQLGAATFLELVEAETVKAQADRDRIAAIFAYHDALASLEALVGTSLRSR
jgi:outer membrane protein